MAVLGVGCSAPDPKDSEDFRRMFCAGPQSPRGFSPDVQFCTGPEEPRFSAPGVLRRTRTAILGGIHKIFCEGKNFQNVFFEFLMKRNIFLMHDSLNSIFLWREIFYKVHLLNSQNFCEGKNIHKMHFVNSQNSEERQKIFTECILWIQTTFCEAKNLHKMHVLCMSFAWRSELHLLCI